MTERMSKQQIQPNTTLFPVPVVLVTCGSGASANIFTLNRIASCNAEPPLISISVRPARASHDLIMKHGEFVVNIPWADMEVVTDFVGSTTMKELDKWAVTGLTPLPGAVLRAPLVAECPVNLECRVDQSLALPSHTLFVAEVVAVHAEESILDDRGEVAFSLSLTGITYRSSVVRERPIDVFKPASLEQAVRARRHRR